MGIFTAIMIIGLVNFACSNAQNQNINILNYKAVADGITDNSQAFLNAWKDVCNKDSSSTLIIPKGKTFMVNPTVFKGPCKAQKINILVLGNIVAPLKPSAWKGVDSSQWLAFQDVTGLTIDGSGLGTINGRGQSWWDQSCRYHPKLAGCTSLAPTALKFLSCNATILRNIQSVNSSQAHILIMGCNGFDVDNVTLTAPGDSLNTDGIHIQSTHQLTISNSRIGTGDDCVSIGDYTSNVNISYVQCGPGHGISIGSLGRGGNFVQVEDIHVSNVNFTETTNGARIKTWQVGKGYVKGVVYENLNFNAVENPIIIDQNYCEVAGTCKELKTGVQISNVTFKNLIGSSATDIAINLNCSKSVPCTGIVLNSVNLTPAPATSPSKLTGNKVTSACSNAHGNAAQVQPAPCLQN